MSLEEEATRAMSRGGRVEGDDVDSKITNLQAAVRELQEVAARLAKEIDEMKGT
jgi:predicted transcriptional regulator